MVELKLISSSFNNPLSSYLAASWGANKRYHSCHRVDFREPARPTSFFASCRLPYVSALLSFICFPGRKNLLHL